MNFRKTFLLPGILFLWLATIACSQPALDDFNPGLNGAVRAIAVQHDGKIIIGGDFTTVGGSNCAYLARLNFDGSLDPYFTHGFATNVSALALQADGKILVGSVLILKRLDGNGTPDSTYIPGTNVGTNAGTITNTGTIIVQPDGKAVVAGAFAGPVVRLNVDGTTDPAFTAAGGHPTMAQQPDGKILFRGAAWGPGSIRRFNANGSVDTNYSVALWYAGAAHWTYLSKLVSQRDGKMLIGGNFDFPGPPSNLLRLTSDGTVDFTFMLSDYMRFVDSLALHPNGKIIFLSVYALNRCGASGVIDTNFNFAFSPNGSFPHPWALAVQSDGNILIGGDFDNVNGVPRQCLARIISGEPVPKPQVVRFTKEAGGLFRFTTTNLWKSGGITVLASADPAVSADDWRVVGFAAPTPDQDSFEFTDPLVATNAATPHLFYQLRYQP